MKQIVLQNIHYAYGDDDVLDDVTLTMGEGDGCVLLAGKNGCGKSTLLNVLCGFLTPYQGHVKRHVSIGYLPFDSPLYEHLTVKENLRYFYRSFHDKNLNMKDTQVQHILAELSIDYLEQRVDQCSSGQRQKAGVAMILLSGADMIIMDEPFVAMDTRSVERLIALISTMKKHTMFLITSHMIASFIGCVDRMITLEAHKLMQVTTDITTIKSYLHEVRE